MEAEPTAKSSKIAAKSDGLRIYPNPATDQITLVSTIENDKLRVEIRDLSGRSVLSETLKLKGFFINLELNLLNGAYLIQVENLDHEKVTRKLIVAK